MDGNTAGSDAIGVARTLITDNSYLTLATADADGVPWATPVWFASRGLDMFVWASKPGTRHSLNITENGRISLVIFDSSKPPGTGTALYVSADAAQADDSSFPDALAVYNERSVKRGLGEWSSEQLRDAARHRLYVAITREAFVLDDHDERIRLQIH